MYKKIIGAAILGLCATSMLNAGSPYESSKSQWNDSRSAQEERVNSARDDWNSRSGQAQEQAQEKAEEARNSWQSRREEVEKASDAWNSENDKWQDKAQDGMGSDAVDAVEAAKEEESGSWWDYFFGS